jgi:AcrR family transcriptional regulator
LSERKRSAESSGRPYRLQARAAGQDETRRRITEATVQLHEERGMLATTISAIAERAGVQRLTVYRHFPDEDALFDACIAHYFALHPRPDPAAWRAVPDPVARLQQGLAELYAYWRSTEAMFGRALRDNEIDPERTRAEVLVAYLSRCRDALLPGWPARGRPRRRLKAVVGHAVDFRTWRSLVRDQGLSDDEAIDLMVALAKAATA